MEAYHFEPKHAPSEKQAPTPGTHLATTTAPKNAEKSRLACQRQEMEENLQVLKVQIGSLGDYHLCNTVNKIVTFSIIQKTSKKRHDFISVTN